jgi:hypothetical protein
MAIPFFNDLKIAQMVALEVENARSTFLNSP